MTSDCIFLLVPISKHLYSLSNLGLYLKHLFHMSLIVHGFKKKKKEKLIYLTVINLGDNKRRGGNISYFSGVFLLRKFSLSELCYLPQ